jgi:hypothetical protein
MPHAAAALLVLLLAGCSAGDGPDASPGQTGSGTARELSVEQIASDAPGRGSDHPQVVLARSSAALSQATGMEIPNPGQGTYLAAYWGAKPTGGYSVSVRGARAEGDRVTVRLALERPPPDAIVTQAFTYPYAVALLRDLDPRGKDFSFVDLEGRGLD